MKGTTTFSMIKPDAVEEKRVGAIIDLIERVGFAILSMRLTKLEKDTAGEFYHIHRGRPFYEEMCSFIASGPVVVMALEKANAVADFRELLGATDPNEAAEGTLRKRFGQSIGRNAVHGSDSDETATEEQLFFFPNPLS